MHTQHMRLQDNLTDIVCCFLLLEHTALAKTPCAGGKTVAAGAIFTGAVHRV